MGASRAASASVSRRVCGDLLAFDNLKIRRSTYGEQSNAVLGIALNGAKSLRTHQVCEKVVGIFGLLLLLFLSIIFVLVDRVSIGILESGRVRCETTLAVGLGFRLFPLLVITHLQTWCQYLHHHW